MAEETLDNGRAVPKRFTTGPTVPCPFSTVTAAIRQAASSYPDSVAAIDLSQAVRREISYVQLEVRARRLAQRLRRAGVGPGDRLPLVVRRGIEMLVGILAILLCGAQYVPLDGGIVTEATMQTVISQSGGRVVVCTASTRSRWQQTDSEIVRDCRYLCVEDGADDAEEAVDAIDLATPGSGCYVIYTSGTTGTPKGVDVTHANVTNLVCSSPGDLGIRPGIRVGQVLNISFDMAAWEIFACLCNGGTLVLRGSDWAPTLKEIDVLICTPSILSRHSPEEFPNIKVVATAGEPSNQLLADKWAKHGAYYNCCGPTETTIVNTMLRHRPGEPLTIGKPTPNNSVYILDDDLRPVVVGQVGTLWAGGRGVSRGYVGLPDMTAAKFRQDPFAGDGSMMYNSGDLGRWLASGEIEVLGRRDDQVKVKGFRVELDGVAHVMAAAPSVQNAYAVLVDGEIHGFLHPENCDTQQVMQQVEKVLPYYSRPVHLHTIACIPLTQNGKVDKAALRAIAVGRNSPRETTGSYTESAPTHPDLELGIVDSKEKGSIGTSSGGSSSILDLSRPIAQMGINLEGDLPDKDRQKFFRNLVHRVFIPYRFLLMLVYLGNFGALASMYVNGINRAWIGYMIAIDLLLAVLIRQDMIINALYTIFCSIPTWWPLWIRASCAKIYHLGGVHAGAATWSSLWLLAANISDVYCFSSRSCGSSYPYHSTAFQVVSWMLTVLFAIMLAFALPQFRTNHHDFFERSHRFIGWTMLGLFWVQNFLGVADAATSTSSSYASGMVSAPGFWILVVATLSIASSWFWLRKVRVASEVLSNHAIRLHFDYTVPVNGTFTRLSFRPLLEWHSFATVPAPESQRGYPAGYSLVVSNAGDWTRACIQKAPTHVWVRGLPTCGVMRIATLFNRIVIVATGSGIGPLLGHIQQPTCATACLWSTKDPVKTYGSDVVDLVKRQIPGAVIWDTTAQGRPDMVKLSYNMARSFRAEAVIIIANRKITTKVCYGLETRGVHAYGAIWDS
ncbi:AMP-binding enzyme [Parathielavia appendiculata]|uniref:AMP-binding enzyme n=1 Tax=Parathielavia appendiculata TaxID=2587402 RepID=A0AAN6U147_9PEZI|nr:AMP-binding enzyme [Parathielavia appendiculata]